MVPYQLDHCGICTSCETAVNELHILECYDCKEKFHGDCDNSAGICMKSFMKSFNGRRNKQNFIFVCDSCITRREYNEASSMKEQLASVVSAVASLTKEVEALKS